MSTITASAEAAADQTTDKRTAPRPPLEHLLRAEVRSLADKVGEDGICSRSAGDAWTAQGLTQRRARLLCKPCRARGACLRLAVLEEALAIDTHGGSIHDLHGARGGLTGPARAPEVKQVLADIRGDRAQRKAAAMGHTETCSRPTQ
ncbi:hypothetical protein SAMN05421874_128141 [Nonomuraea maritima]|uniref:Transcription factor WhiB n=1 Tax=Nonomuraea maritima TaxID=683260 RepID=A0A1G9MQW9_9ACTN|nr:hypothetical protein [Nonomuraea maritima]SDL76504.1 hypothetical protein SAMN05421874_128141 [Nonomuraea maritima]